jgi:poly-beta-hydroxyalkanoate depolymerase
VLKRNGRFILSVPEGKKLWSSHDVAVSHVKRYEKPEFAALAQRAGLKIDKIYSRNVFLKPFAIVIRKFRTGSDLGPVPWILNKFLLLIAIIEHKLGTRKICGMTIWLHGRKP